MSKQTRIAFVGAAGTGKTTLAKIVGVHFNIPFIEIGSRSVAKSMGYDNPYDVDLAGERAEFQRRLLTQKIAAEISHDSFVTDRTTVDNLIYSYLHFFKNGELDKLSSEHIKTAIAHMNRYTRVYWCSMASFWSGEDDGVRIVEKKYQEMYEKLLYGVYKLECDKELISLPSGDIDVRAKFIELDIASGLES